MFEKCFLGWLSESLVVSIYKKNVTGDGGSSHPEIKNETGDGGSSRPEIKNEPGMVVRPARSMIWAIYVARPSISLTSNGGATHGFYD